MLHCQQQSQLIVVVKFIIRLIPSMAKFSVKKSTMVKGGHNPKSFTVDTESCEDIDFFKPKIDNYGLYKAMGLMKDTEQGKKRAEAQVPLWQFIKNKRNAKVSQLIVEAMTAEDPMADVEVEVVEARDDIKKRAEAFAKYNIAATVTIQIPAFFVGEQLVHAKDLKVIATAKKNETIALECTTDVFDWLFLAVQADWTVEDDVDGPKWDISDLPVLPSPLNYGYSRHNNKLTIIANVRSKGKWRRHSKMIQDRLEKEGGTKQENDEVIKQVCAIFCREIDAMIDGDDKDDDTTDPDA